ncbi:hypothetical protein ASPWEDRAFT_177183 [Aspergillus wentii DTO 134E9]|uniref:Zn(2)-C6 fungal-type domain-containing protein n=1 Tax=Aspergillus wentii DTO 134E9 TaxID=1073089 RepID=A0A1L9R6J1_ASPWE|nr:uncharacterized protein ASPWEDRAFT_177183 [Aspergillus wentii DTO 134E9]OJJ30530.1 hypothetical protein ASPWEDRAFT_177183 [Aspergillus wentii DTO 134E9]
MVGVPHSTGCSLCRERRIKCDKAVPSCTQCRRYGRPCPGYRRTFIFQDERPALERRHKSTTPVASKSPPGASENDAPESQKKKKEPTDSAAAAVRKSAIAMMKRHAAKVGGVSLDESLNPSLVRKSFVGQQPQLFGDFISAAFPTLYFHNRFRADDHPDFPSYIMQTFGTHAYQDSTVCCLSSVYLAHLTQDPALVKVSRQMYGIALREVVRALNTPEASSDNMLSTVMMLSVYEMYAQTSKDSWVHHANGVKRLMLSRGVKAHESGFGRSCYIAFRGFLIATAVYEGTPCFLDREEWQKFAAMIRCEDSQKPGEWSAFVDISELAFMEMTKCPRYLSEAREIDESASPVRIADLVQRMRDTSQKLIRLTAELRVCIGAHSQRKQGIVYRPGSFIGPVPTIFPETSPSLLLRGAESTIAALRHLMDRLEAIMDGPRVEEISPSAASSGVSHFDNKPRTFSLPFRVVSELGRGPSKTSDEDDPRAVIWLDRVASSMGMLGTEIVHGAGSVASEDSPPETIEEVFE